MNSPETQANHKAEGSSTLQTKESLKEAVLLEPYKYLSEIPGKGVRSTFIKAFNAWLQIDEEHLNSITNIIEVLHTSSLLYFDTFLRYIDLLLFRIDDIEDNIAHAIYGVAATINCGNYMYFKALEQCASLGSTEATNIFIEELINLHRGQGFDIYWRDNNQCPTEEEYKEMVSSKTGGLFRLAVRLMQCFSSDKRDYIPLVNNLGLFFQIRDDYINLQSTEYMTNKSFCEDLTEGKFSFPIIHSILSSNDTKLLRILKQKSEDVELKKYALTLMEQTGSFEYTKKVLDSYLQKINEAIKQLGGNKELEAIVEYLATSDK